VEKVLEYLSSISSEGVVRKGKAYFESGNVLSVTCLENSLYATVKGSSGYHSLRIHPDGCVCSCGAYLLRKVVCSHMVAAILKAHSERGFEYAKRMVKTLAKWRFGNV